MKKSRFSENQIIKILKEGENGVPLADLCRQYGFGKSCGGYLTHPLRV